MSDRSAAYNNAGVRVMEAGHGAIAMELFRAALESKLSFERSQTIRGHLAISGHSSISTDAVIVGCRQGQADTECQDVSLECIRRAELHLLNLESYLSFAPTQECQQTSDHSTGAISTIVVPAESRGYDPYICSTAFSIPEHSNFSAQVVSSIIVYNLGLAHQNVNRGTETAALFFEISATLLSNFPSTTDTLLLRIALLNNFGVWCFENGDGESMHTSMEHLAIALKFAEDGNGSIDVLIQQGVRSNIRHMLTPLEGASPAA
jgi:hypothetical protein